MDIFEVLKELNIKYEELEHRAIYTVDEAKKIDNMIEGVGCKNLFLTDKKDNYFLYVLPEDKRADLTSLRKVLKVSRLTFGNEEELHNLLGLEKGSVTPLGIINDNDIKVILILDGNLVGRKLLMHPNTNTMTISMMYEDLLKVVDYTKHKIEIVNI